MAFVTTFSTKTSTYFVFPESSGQVMNLQNGYLQKEDIWLREKTVRNKNRISNIYNEKRVRL